MHGGRLTLRYFLLFAFIFTCGVFYNFLAGAWLGKRWSFEIVGGWNNRHFPFFKRAPNTENLDCDRFLLNDFSHINLYSKYRITLSKMLNDESALDMSCEAIRSRHYFPEEPLSYAEANFPIAFARIIYRDYPLIEMTLAANYAPQNWYCYMLDSKAPSSFQRKIFELAECFPNVFIARRNYIVKRKGVNMDASFVECMKELLSEPIESSNMESYYGSKKDWKYVILLQNHDISVRTNLEMVQILSWLNGTNDVEITRVPRQRVPKANFSFTALDLFRNYSRNLRASNGFEPILQLSKGYVECALSREMAEFMIFELDLSGLLALTHQYSEFGREILVPSLHATDALNAPGGFTHRCLDMGKRVQHITRYSVWYNKKFCASHQMRNGICVFGMEDLGQTLAYLPHLFANKMMPEFDWGAIVCWHETLFNRTYVEEPTLTRLNEELYRSLPHVRFNEMRRKKGFDVARNSDFCDFPTKFEI